MTTSLPRPFRITGLLEAAALAGLMLALQAGGAPVRSALRYERSAILAGEIWRLLTAHFVHLGWVHCLLNLAALSACVALSKGRLADLSWIGAIAMLGTAVGLLLLGVSPEVGNYVGLSGVLYGLFVVVLAPRVWRGEGLALAMLVYVLGRMAWQLIHMPPEQTVELIGGHVVAQAHLDGVVGGALLLTWQAWRSRRIQRAAV